MKTATYVRGWKWDWSISKLAMDALTDGCSRPELAAAHADPGVVSCPHCNEYHWNEFQVFLCNRCGAEVTSGHPAIAGPPPRPYMIPPRLFDGMRVEFVGLPVTRDGVTRLTPAKRRGITILEIGQRGTIRYKLGEWNNAWLFDMDGRRPGGERAWVMHGPMLEEGFVAITGWESWLSKLGVKHVD